MSPDSFPCDRCGKPQRTIEVTAYGDKAPRYVPVGCDCPEPHCPFCHVTVDHAGRCRTVDCFMWMAVVPVPEMR